MVLDLVDALNQLQELGIQPIGVNLDNPFWKEAFLHPREAFGIVIQVAQSAGEWSTDPPDDLPTPRTLQPAEFTSATLVVSNLPAARDLFVDLLGGEIRTTTTTPKGIAIDLVWHNSPLMLRLLGSGENHGDSKVIHDYLGHLPGKLSHLEFSALELPEMNGVPISRDTLVGYISSFNDQSVLITKFAGTPVVIHKTTAS